MRVAYESEEGQERRETSGKRGEWRDERGGIRSRKERRPGEWDIERRRDADPRKPWRHATRQLLLPRSKPCTKLCGPHRLLVFPDLRRVFLILFARTKTCSPHVPGLCTPRYTLLRVFLFLVLISLSLFLYLFVVHAAVKHGQIQVSFFGTAYI